MSSPTALKIKRLKALKQGVEKLGAMTLPWNNYTSEELNKFFEEFLDVAWMAHYKSNYYYVVQDIRHLIQNHRLHPSAAGEVLRRAAEGYFEDLTNEARLLEEDLKSSTELDQFMPDERIHSKTAISDNCFEYETPVGRFQISATGHARFSRHPAYQAMREGTQCRRGEYVAFGSTILETENNLRNLIKEEQATT